MTKTHGDSTWTRLFKSKSMLLDETTRANPNQETTTSKPTRYHGGWLTPRVLPNINLRLGLFASVPLNTTLLHESPVNNQSSLERHIQDTLEEL